jgi:hypothetical protein
MKLPKGKNANYDFSAKKQPKSRMGQSGFSNLPDKAMIKDFGFKANYRDGIVNDYTHSITDISGIDENEC